MEVGPFYLNKGTEKRSSRASAFFLIAQKNAKTHVYGWQLAARLLKDTFFSLNLCSRRWPITNLKKKILLDLCRLNAFSFDLCRIASSLFFSMNSSMIFFPAKTKKIVFTLFLILSYFSLISWITFKKRKKIWKLKKSNHPFFHEIFHLTWFFSNVFFFW